VAGTKGFSSKPTRFDILLCSNYGPTTEKSNIFLFFYSMCPPRYGQKSWLPVGVGMSGQQFG